MPAHLRRLVVVVALLFLPLSLTFRALFAGEAFVPADLLGYVAPWSGSRAAPPPAAWNVLRYDGITQFYPWRHEAARQIKAGRIPLRNPYAFAASGGTPLLADSQSAPLYPPNFLFYLFPPSALWYAFGLSAALHLTVMATGTYRFSRGGGVSRPAALLAATVFTLSAPVVCWLALPTFLCVSCWLPWLFALLRVAHTRAGSPQGRAAVWGAGGVAGLMLLAGHLQIAMFAFLATGGYALWQGVGTHRLGRLRPLSWLAGAVAVIGLAGLLAACQLLPAVELSRVSHRAVAGRPSMEMYAAFTANALPVRNLVTLLVPDFFGHPNPPQAPYWNTNNYGEWAMYTGVLPLLLAAYALAARPWRKPAAGDERGFWAGLALLALLVAMGTPVNLPLFFLLPGYAQTGNPARCLFLFAFALAHLAAQGLDTLLRPLPTAEKTNGRAALIAVVVPGLLAAGGASAAAQFFPDIQTAVLREFTFADMLAFARDGLLRAGLWLGVGITALFASPRFTVLPRRNLIAGAIVVIAAADLLLWGAGYNPTSPAADVYPVTPGIAYLQTHGADALIAPLNRGWSLGLFRKLPPRGAVLPPNSLTVYGLHDIGGYDSLFPRASRDTIREATGNDPTPPENGNMVFVKTAEAATKLGARYLVTSPAAPPLPDVIDSHRLTVAYTGADLVIYENADAPQVAPAAPALSYSTFRVGLFGGVMGAGLLAAFVGANAIRRKVRRVS